jgi:hypothetical protein
MEFEWKAYTVPSIVIDFNPLCATAAPAKSNGIAQTVIMKR